MPRWTLSPPALALANKAFSFCGFPAIWSWQIAWWIVGIVMMWALCFKAEMSTTSEEQIRRADTETLEKALEHSQSADDQRYLFGSVAQAYSWCGDQNKALEYFRRAVDIEGEPDAILPQAIGFGELRRATAAEDGCGEGKELAP